MCGKECYESMEMSFQELFEEVNATISDGGVDVDGEFIESEFFLAGDYKVIMSR